MFGRQACGAAGFVGTVAEIALFGADHFDEEGAVGGVQVVLNY
jgi:hypothetical protein